jgi:tetratricopeptide (TPR) repeat protein
MTPDQTTPIHHDHDHMLPGNYSNTMLDRQLDVLEHAGLLRMTQLVPELQYIFRHALVQEAAYASLLRQDRKRLHLAAGEVIERHAADRLEEFAPMLGQHFDEAGDITRAARYYTLAGEHAMRQYAVHEAVTQYSNALEVVRQINDAGQLAILFRKRAIAYETLGDFDRARADHEAALHTASDAQDVHTQWQTLLDLGMLWAGRDYIQTGEYYQQAYQLAEQMGDAGSLAHTLNHLGNRMVNVEQTQEAIHYHEQALSIFEQLNDMRGIADTTDFLGMASALSGKMQDAIAYYRRSIDLLKQLDDRHRLALVLAATGLRSANYQTDISVASATLPEAIQDVEFALQAARQTGWRSVEAFALNCLAFCLGSQGDYTRALDSAQQSLAISQEIGHLQWQTYASCALGAIHLDMLLPPMARLHLEQALSLAKQTNSTYWVRTTSNFLASVFAAQGDLDKAQAILDELPVSDPASLTLSQRHSWCIRAELAVARGMPGEALSIADMLYRTGSQSEGHKTILRLSKLRGAALADLGSLHEAETELTAGEALAREQDARPMQWRFLASLARVYEAQGRLSESEQAGSAAKAITADLAARIPEDLRDEFIRASVALIAAAPRRSPK